MSSKMKVATLGGTLVASLALAVPASGAIRPDDRSGVRGVPTLSATVGVRPDDRAGFRGAGGTSPLASVRPDDRPGFRGIARMPDTTLGGNRSVAGADSGFDWTAAGAGAGTATTVALLLAWALTLRRNHQRAEASV
jgi:hypothetical protein